MHVVYVLVNDKGRMYLYVLIKEGFISKFYITNSRKVSFLTVYSGNIRRVCI